jgi:Ni,Fe-hydrogenase maturation factor
LEGSRRAFSADFIRTLADDFRLHGRQAIEKVRKQQPAAYMKICALLVPREMKVEHTQGLASLTDEQIETAIAAIREMLDQREKALDAGQLIEGKAEPVALPAPGGD